MFWHQRDEECRSIAKGELADAAGRDPIFIEKINWSFLTEFVAAANSRAQVTRWDHGKTTMDDET
jgi:hypothetical protein